MEFGVLSLLPPLVAIVLALITRSVIPALLLGVWIGATMVNGWNPLYGVYATFSDFIIPSVGNEGNASILIYCAFFGGLVAVLQRTGGARAVAQAITRRVSSDRGAQTSTFLFGIFIFFEDYFNALTVGNVMRPITDRFNVSREKLAYIVDSTSAPVCLLGPVSTWIVFVMGLIGAQFQQLDMSGSTYVAYLRTIPYNFYAIAALSLVGIIALSRIEYGPMAKAEKRARDTGQVVRPGSQPPTADEMTLTESEEDGPSRARNMIVPLAVLLALVPVLFLWTGGFPEADLLVALGESNGALSIMIAAFAAGVVALLLAIWQRTLNFTQAIDTYVSGIKGMALVYVILTLAWSIGSVAEAVGTADYIVAFVQQLNVAPLVFFLVFLISAIIAFTTGTSYGTFAIMIPIAVPLAASLDLSIYAAIAAVLSGGIFGDHCSPISDTTVLSSAGSACDHADHVNTQMPYAITGALSGAAAFLVIGFTGSLLLSLTVAGITLVGLALLFNKVWRTRESRVKETEPTAS